MRSDVTHFVILLLIGRLVMRHRATNHVIGCRRGPPDLSWGGPPASKDTRLDLLFGSIWRMMQVSSFSFGCYKLLIVSLDLYQVLDDPGSS